MSVNDVLVLTVRKGFWASQACEIFPNRLYTPSLYGPSHSLVNSGLLALRGVVEIWRRRPKLVVVGYAHRIAPWLAVARRLGLLGGAGLVITNRKELPDARAHLVDRIVEYSRGELTLRPPVIRERSIFVPLAPPGDFEAVLPAAGEGEYVFAGGGGLRDFPSLIEAFRDLEARLLIVTFSSETLGYEKPLPPNCEVRYRMPLPSFLALMAGAKLVAAPLQPGREPHGQTTVAQALRLGKAVVSTRNASIDDYMADEREGLLVDPGDVEGYRRAIERLLGDDELRAACEDAARVRASDLTNEAHAARLVALCREVLATA
jgi:glycosyltransferase involved in cell wall biosynthesis